MSLSGRIVRSSARRVDSERIAPVFTIEQLLYSLFFVVALLTRFWDLGSRALHHDESEHAYYSWVYAMGGGYKHDPLLHGPFLFHANALVYWLFGTSDALSRVFPSAVGVLIVLLPWLLRSERLLGRWGALSASFLLLISPSILYYSRFIRHDVYCLCGTFLLFIAIVRYVEMPQARWAILGGGAVGFLLCTKEVSFIVLFLFVSFLAVALAYRVAPSLFAVAAGALLLLGAIVKLLRTFNAPPLPAIPWSNPSGADIQHFAIKLITHPLIVGAFGVLLLAVVVALWRLDHVRDRERGWIDGLLGDAPAGSTAAALRELLLERRGLVAGIVLALGLFTLLYTSLFTNMEGLASGSFGALGYWLGQQNVQRGAEPWFYYLLLIPQYEFIGVLFFPLLSLWFAVRSWRAHRRGEPLGHRSYMRALLIWWATGMVLVLSWAGEKMPWLTVHVALPMLLLVASYLDAALAWLDRRRRAWRPGMTCDMALFGATLIGLAGTAFLVTAWASDGPFVQRMLRATPNADPTLTWVHVMRSGLPGGWWLTVGLPWLALAVVIIAGVVRLGVRRAAVALLLASTLGLSLLQVHTEWRLTYRQGDVAKDMLIYVQTTPDVPRLTDQLAAMSEDLNGNMGLEVWFDDLTAWPFNWYLRDFTSRHFYGNQLPAGQTMTAPVVLVADDNVTDALKDVLKENYTYQEYPMRWWFPENETYRRFAYAPDLNNSGLQNLQDQRQGPYSLTDTGRSALRSIGSLRNPQEAASLFRLLAFRETTYGLGTFNFRVYIRNDLLPLFNSIRYSEDTGG
jgi:predicted membrane-bound mannosyltransferase